MATMQVETYEVDEVAMATPEDHECALALVNKLGLAKQKAMYEPGTQKAAPFREFTKEEHFVYRLLFPETTDLVQYAREPIPLRVLEVAEKATECGMFKKLVVWHEKDVRLDPILVGIAEVDVGAAPHVWKQERPYILARWGAALEEWPALTKKAREKAVAQLSSVHEQVGALIARAKVCPLDQFAPAFQAYFFESSVLS
jgi:hypothetical protein